jgi:hypothetical protein
MNVPEVRLSTQEDEAVVRGQAFPCRVLAQNPETCIVLADGYHRISGANGCSFTCDFRGEITNGRLIRVSKVIIPKLPTINPNNYQITIRHELDLGTPISFTLPYGWKNQVSLINDLKLAFDTACSGLPDTFAVSYNASTHVISITSNGGHRWFFDANCSFILRGIDVAGFAGKNVSLAPGVEGALSHYSSSASFVYSRYVTVHSNTLQRYIRTQSRTSTGDLTIIACISIIDDLTPADFDTSGLFNGASLSEITLEDAPKNSFTRAYANVRYMDFEFKDQYGLPIYDAINISPSGRNSFSCVVWLTIDL